MNPATIGTLGGILVMLAGIFAAASNRTHRERAERTKLLARALERPDLDDATRRQILAALAIDHDRPFRRMLNAAANWRSVCFSIGWLLFVLFGGAMLLNVVGAIHLPDDELLGLTALAGLALMTLPLGLRELLRRDGDFVQQR